MIKKLINRFFKNKSAISFQQGFDLTSLPVVTFYQGGKKINFLLDTGSTSSIIDKTFLETLEYTKSNLAEKLTGLEGSVSIVRVCNINISYNDIHFTAPFLIKDMTDVFTVIKNSTGVTIHGILGSKFFNKYKYVLDFSSLIAYIKQ